jgi:hypothetical protein
MRPLRYLSAGIGLALASMIGAATVQAQEDAQPPHFAVVAGIFQYDLSGTGIAPMLAFRGTAPLTTVLTLEGGLLAARPGQQFGSTTTMLVPEAQVQLTLPFDRVTPYMGLGAGAAFDFRGTEFGGIENFLSISGALGIRGFLRDGLGVQAEFRGRGLGFDFTGSSAEYTIGVIWLR